MAGYHCHQRLFGAELWTDPWLSQNGTRREVTRTVIQLADGFGKLYDSDDLAARIKIMFFPIDENVTEEQIEKVLEDLTERHALCAYTVDGDEYLHLPKWSKYQQIAPSKRGRSNIPDCPKHGKTYKHDGPPQAGQDDDGAAPTKPKPSRAPARAAKAKPEKPPYEPSTEAVSCFDAWNKKSPLPNQSMRIKYCRVFDDMHDIDNVAWSDIYAICQTAVTLWLPNGWLESPMKLRKPSREYEDMKTWQVIKSKMDKSGNAKIEDAASTTVKGDASMNAALAKAATER